MPVRGLDELLRHFPDAKLVQEGGFDFVYIPGLRLSTGEVVSTHDVLLCPQAHSGYPTRFFVDQQIPGKGQNWKSFSILGKQWWSCSINGIPADQACLQILLAFLGHFQ